MRREERERLNRLEDEVSDMKRDIWKSKFSGKNINPEKLSEADRKIYFGYMFGDPRTVR